MFAHAHEDFDPRSHRAGCLQLRSEVGDWFSSDHIPMVVQGEDNLSSMLEFLGEGVSWEESAPHEEDEFHEGAELDCSVVAGALGVFT